MKKEKIFAAIGNIDDELIERYLQYKPINKNSYLKYISIAACICIAVVGVTFIMRNNNNDDIIFSDTQTQTEISDTPIVTSYDIVTETPPVSIIPDESSSISTSEIETSSPIVSSTSEQKATETEITEPEVTEGVPIPKWDELTTPQQYTEAKFNNVTYSTREKLAPANRLGNSLGAVKIQGRDEYTGELHSITTEAIKLIDISSECAIAVKIKDEYYVYINTKYKPETLKDFIEDVDFENTLSFGSVDYGYFNEDMDYIREEYAGLDSSAVWDILFADQSLKSICGEENDALRLVNVMSIGTNVDVIGYKNISIGVTKDGYLTTNILSSGKAYFIGTDKVQEFIDYVKNNCQLVSSINSSQYDESEEDVIPEIVVE